MQTNATTVKKYRRNSPGHTRVPAAWSLLAIRGPQLERGAEGPTAGRRGQSCRLEDTGSAPLVADLARVDPRSCPSPTAAVSSTRKKCQTVSYYRSCPNASARRPRHQKGLLAGHRQRLRAQVHSGVRKRRGFARQTFTVVLRRLQGSSSSRNVVGRVIL